MATEWEWSTLRLCLIVTACIVCSRGDFFAAPPSYGDLVLQQYINHLYITLAPDGVEQPEYMHPVCGDNLNEKNKVGAVISRQLGYEVCALTFPAMIDQEHSFGAAGITCTGNEYHIMRCQITLPEVLDDCKSFLKVSCEQKDSLYYTGSTVGNKAYQGQVLLHPHSPTGRGIATASMGMVGVKEEGDGCNYWRFIEITSHVDLTLASTLCRQMGFTYVSAILSKHEAELMFALDFTKWMEWIGLSTFPTSDINCGEISHECLGCCNYTQYLTCPDAPSNIQASADEGSILVLRCSLYRDKEVLSEGGKQCGFQNDVIGTTCDQIPFGDIQLHDGSSAIATSGGRVEYNWNLKWRTICSLGFSKQEADLVCRKLGFLYADKFGNVSSLGYPMGSDDQPIITLSCPDSAPSNCSVTVSTCDHSEDVGIICTNENGGQVCLMKQELVPMVTVPVVVLLALCMVLVVALVIVFCRRIRRRRGTYEKVDN